MKQDARFGADHRLRRRGDFLRVRRLGVRFQTAHFVVYLAKLPDQPQPRLGLAVSRRIGNAVVRNRIKRRLRESFRCSFKPMLYPGLAMLVIARDGAADLGTPEVTVELQSAIARMLTKLNRTSDGQG